MNQLYEYLLKTVEGWGMNLLVALAILLIGIFAIKIILKTIATLFAKRKLDSAVGTFIQSVLNVLLWILLIIIALSKLGVQTTSFVAILGAAGLAVGLALQGSLSNIAAGFLLIMFRPFSVGDAVEVCGILGTVRSIKLFQTEIISFDNRKHIIPNNQIMNNVLTNITSEPFRRIELLFSVSLDTNIILVKKVITDIISAHPLSIKNDDSMPIIVRMSNISRDSLDFTVRVWSKTTDYWSLYFDLNEQIKISFDKNHIILPLPQMEVKQIS